MRIASPLALSLALFSFATTVQAAPIESLPAFDGRESFESITAATPNVSYFDPAKVLSFSADLLLPSGVTLAYLGDPFASVVCNYSVGSPTSSMGANGTISSASNVAFGSAYVLGNFGTVRIKFPQAVVAAGAYVTGNPGSVTVTAYGAANNVIETRTKPTVPVSAWKNNFAGIVDPAGTIRAVEITANGAQPAVDEVRFLTAFRTQSGLATEPPGANCAYGGAVLGSGPDTNANGVLEQSEIVSRVYACNGSDGARGESALISVTAEVAGANCPNGGQKVESGVDTDKDGKLDAGEVTATTYVCNGANGTNGTNGSNGADGTPGPAGAGGCSAAPGGPLPWELGMLLLTLPLFRRRRAAAVRS